MKIWLVTLANFCLIALASSVRAAPESEATQDPIGRKRLTEAYVFLMNAVTLSKGGAVVPKPKLEKSAEGLSNHELRGQISVMADTVEKNFSQIPTEPQELAVTTRLRAARIALTTDKNVTLEDIHKAEINRRKRPKHDSPASFLRANVEAIHQALSAK